MSLDHSNQNFIIEKMPTRPKIVLLDLSSYSTIRYVGGLIDGDIPFLVDFVHRIFVAGNTYEDDASLHKDEICLGRVIIRGLLPYTNVDNPLKLGSYEIIADSCDTCTELMVAFADDSYEIEDDQYDNIRSAGVPIPKKWKSSSDDYCSRSRLYTVTESIKFITDIFGSRPFIGTPQSFRSGVSPIPTNHVRFNTML